MTVTTKTGRTIGLTIPDQYYRKLGNLRFASDNGHNHTGHPITADNVYHCYRTLMERLGNWLSEQTEEFGYRTAAFRIIGWEAHTVTLQETDNPFDAFWANNVIAYISDQYRFGGLLDRWENDP